MHTCDGLDAGCPFDLASCGYFWIPMDIPGPYSKTCLFLRKVLILSDTGVTSAVVLDFPNSTVVKNKFLLFISHSNHGIFASTT